jgi:hypothetical protein
MSSQVFLEISRCYVNSTAPLPRQAFFACNDGKNHNQLKQLLQFECLPFSFYSFFHLSKLPAHDAFYDFEFDQSYFEDLYYFKNLLN